MELYEIVHAELCANNIKLCSGCAEFGSHRRGWADTKTRTIHLDRGFATRSTVHRALHEIGHIVTDRPGMRRWEEEEAAERWANETMRRYGYSVPRKVQAKGLRYIRRMARWGRNIAAGIRAAK